MYINKSLEKWDTWTKTTVFVTTRHTVFIYDYTPYELVLAKKPNILETMQNTNVYPVYDKDNYGNEIIFRLQCYK